MRVIRRCLSSERFGSRGLRTRQAASVSLKFQPSADARARAVYRRASSKLKWSSSCASRRAASGKARRNLPVSACYRRPHVDVSSAFARKVDKLDVILSPSSDTAFLYNVYVLLYIHRLSVTRLPFPRALRPNEILLDADDAGSAGHATTTRGIRMKQFM